MEPVVVVGIPESCLDFSFGFNNAKYSDRTLLLHIVAQSDLPINSTTAVARVKTIRINSLILEARSPFFRKLFSNGMRESEENSVIIQIEASEENSFMDLLKYVYSNNLSTTLDALLDLMMIADKFEVVSCLRDCTRALQNLPMTCESASVYLDLPPNLLMSSTIRPLIDAAKQFLVSHFKCLDKSKEEVLNLPLASIQAVLSSDELRVTSECTVYDIVLSWVHKHYPDMEERREILKTHLLHLIRFPFMATKKLTDEVLTCNDIDPDVASKIVTCAFSYKAEEGHAASRQYVERAYKIRLVKVVEPHQECCIVYLDLTREALTRFPYVAIASEVFQLGRQRLSLAAERCFDEGSNCGCFDVTLKECESSANYEVKYELALKKKPSENFECWGKGIFSLTVEPSCKWLKLVPWPRFREEYQNPYFINDVVHVRLQLTISEMI